MAERLRQRVEQERRASEDTGKTKQHEEEHKTKEPADLDRFILDLFQEVRHERQQKASGRQLEGEDTARWSRPESSGIFATRGKDEPAGSMAAQRSASSAGDLRHGRAGDLRQTLIGLGALLLLGFSIWLAGSPSKHSVMEGTGPDPASLDAQLTEKAAGDPAPPLEPPSTLRFFTLQVAAFPTQSGADEFAEKLKQAGVLSYVAPVDLARRGSWFRVRVGRLNTAEEAQRFAGDAELRARAAGLALQLIVTEYE